MNASQFEHQTQRLQFKNIALHGAMSGLVFAQTLAWQDVISRIFTDLFDTDGSESLDVLTLKALFVTTSSVVGGYLLVKCTARC
jgi:hypothetical protein